jgi:hypothetical protein
MWLLKLVNKFLGVLYYLALCLPWICLATVACALLFFDALLKLSFLRILAVPFQMLLILVIGILSALETGWKLGLKTLILTAPARFLYFLQSMLAFGLKESESVSGIFKNPSNPKGLDDLIKPSFFGRIILKFLSLTMVMEMYVAYAAGSAYAHSEVNIYYTENILRELNTKYASRVASKSQVTETLETIQAYLDNKKQTAERERKCLSEEKIGKIQSVQFDIDRIEASIRCVQRFKDNDEIAPDIDKSIACSSAVALCYVWIAIESEAKGESSREGLKEKLILSLYLIQRGYNVSLNDSKGSDVFECPTLALGMLMRTLTDEPERLSNSIEYKADDPNPANLTSALKITLDAPFISSNGWVKTALYQDYARNPTEYKAQRAVAIKSLWQREYGSLTEPRMGKGSVALEPVLKKEELESIVDTGIHDWEPPPCLSP